jgi:hypothetical protein
MPASPKAVEVTVDFWVKQIQALDPTTDQLILFRSKLTTYIANMLNRGTANNFCMLHWLNRVNGEIDCLLRESNIPSQPNIGGDVSTITTPIRVTEIKQQVNRVIWTNE